MLYVGVPADGGKNSESVKTDATDVFAKGTGIAF